MDKQDGSNGMSTKELLLEVRKDVKSLLSGQATQNGAIAENAHCIARHEGWLARLDKRMWAISGVLVFGVVAAIVKGLVT